MELWMARTFDLAGTLTLPVELGCKMERKEGTPNIYLTMENVYEARATIS
jgi:hypothetical protein